MTPRDGRKRLLLLSGLSGAGKSTALKTLEDIGWDVIDNLPLGLIRDVLETPLAPSTQGGEAPTAICFDARTRGFAPELAIATIKRLQQDERLLCTTLFLDCSGAELERRFSETRRRHPLALDRPARDGIALERSQLAPLRRWADHVIDTTTTTVVDLQQMVRRQFAFDSASEMTVTITSFGFSRGIPNNIDLLFDMRFLANPFWVEKLKLLTGLDAQVGDYISADPGFAEGVGKIRELLLFALPRYREAGKAYVNIGIGCTGGRHRSVYVAETLAKDLQAEGFSPTVQHRNMASRPIEALEMMQKASPDKTN